MKVDRLAHHERLQYVAVEGPHDNGEKNNQECDDRAALGQRNHSGEEGSHWCADDGNEGAKKDQRSERWR